MLVIGKIPRYKCAKYNQKSSWFDKVVAKIKWCRFWTPVGYITTPHSWVIIKALEAREQSKKVIHCRVYRTNTNIKGRYEQINISTAVFSELFAICNRPSVRLSVCLSVVCNVGAPYSGDWNFRQYFYALWYLGHPWPLYKNFTEIVPGEPLRRGS